MERELMESVRGCPELHEVDGAEKCFFWGGGGGEKIINIPGGGGREH